MLSESTQFIDVPLMVGVFFGKVLGVAGNVLWWGDHQLALHRRTQYTDPDCIWLNRWCDLSSMASEDPPDQLHGLACEM